MKPLLFLFLLLISAAADTMPVTLAWDKNAEPDVERYELQIGTGPGVYDRTFQVTEGAVQQAVTLETGVLYYAVVSAINTSGIRSLPSRQPDLPGVQARGREAAGCAEGAARGRCGKRRARTIGRPPQLAANLHRANCDGRTCRFLACQSILSEPTNLQTS